MYNIKTLNAISEHGTTLFDNKYTVATDIETPDAVLVRSANMHGTQFNSNLLAIARAGAGVNNIPIDACSDAGICVFNTPGANANAVKEMVIAGLLISSRHIPESIEWAKALNGKGSEIPALVEKGKGNFTGPEIQGKTLGIIGLGAIGILVANTAVSLGMNVIGTDPFLSVNSALRLSPKVTVVSDKDIIFAASDYITIHVPFNKETEGFVNSETLSKCRDGVRILNFARGELVNDADILEAIETGRVDRYVTDFPNAGLIGRDGVIAIPHLGASTPESEDNCAVMAVNQLKDYLENGNITNSVNLPNASMEARGTKVCVIHMNVPNVIAAVTTTVGNAGHNIENMVNASRKNYAYTMLDIIGDVNDSLVESIRSISGVVRVRVI